MGSVLVAGRVEAVNKVVADAVISRAGMTSSDVIRIVWDNIAKTGQVPQSIESDDSPSELMARFHQLRAMTPRSSFLESLTPEGVKHELEGRR